VSNHETAEKALVEGIGYGWLPRQQVQEALAGGRLAQLPLASYPPRMARFYLAWLAARALSEEGRQLAAILRSAIGIKSLAGPEAGTQADDGFRPEQRCGQRTRRASGAGSAAAWPATAA
jgi:hypothetical protein